MIDLWHLTIFKAVVDQKGFSSAARAINLTQPTVSSHIKDLENHFNCRLLDRIGKTTLPTGAGERLYEHVTRLLSLYEETEIAMAEFPGDIQGRLAVGGSTIPAGYMLPRLIGDFLKQYPKVQLALISGDSRQVIDDILEYRLELGIVGAETEHARVSQIKLTRDEMRLIVPFDHDWAGKDHIALDMLFDAPLILRESGSGTLRALQQSLARTDRDFRTLKMVAEFDSTASVIQGIKNRVGLSILSPVAVADELAEGRLSALAVEGLDLSRYFYLTTHRDRTPSPPCQAFIDYIKDHYSQVG